MAHIRLQQAETGEPGSGVNNPCSGHGETAFPFGVVLWRQYLVRFEDFDGAGYGGDMSMRHTTGGDRQSISGTHRVRPASAGRM